MYIYIRSGIRNYSGEIYVCVYFFVCIYMYIFT